MHRWILLLLACFTSPRGDESGASFAERKAAMDPLSRRFLRPNDDVRALPVIDGVAPRAIEFENAVGTLLRGALYDHPGTRRVVVLCLGIRGNHSYLLPYARIVLATPCDVLLFDYQGFGRSDGVANATALLGDTLAAVDFALAKEERSPGDIAVFGLSLGSVLALAAAADRGLAAVVTEDLWIPSEMMDRILGKQPSNTLFALARAAVERVVLPALDPLRNLARFRGRALLMHGDADPLLPPLATARIATTRPQGTRVWFMTGTGHAPESLQTHDREYRAQVIEFLRECFGEHEPRVARAHLEATTDHSATVRVETTGVEFVQVTLGDDRSLRHQLRRLVPGSATNLTATFDTSAPATRAFATPLFTAQARANGECELVPSKLTTDLARFREFERSAIPPAPGDAKNAVAMRLESLLSSLPAANSVAPEVAPRYAVTLAAFVSGAAGLDETLALRAAQSAVKFVPAVPEEWIEIGSGHFAIGLRDARLAQLLAAVAKRARRSGEASEADRLADLARRVTPR